jgi:hypothetical protein
MFKKILAVFVISSLCVFAYAKELQFSGYTSYQRHGGTITLSADRIKNNRNGGKSGTLKVMLWATKYKYRGGRINGYILGQSDLGQLYGNRYFNRIARNVTFYSPPRGRYYMTLTLSEYRYGRYEVVDYVNYSRKERF